MRVIIIWAFVLVSIRSNAQGYGSDKTALANFIKRIYTSMPFEGIKIIDDYDKQYLISVISLDKSKYTTESTLNRVAQVKAQSQANTFVNGATISMDFIISTKEIKDAEDILTATVESVEQIKQSSIGFTQGLELLSNFDDNSGVRRVFIFARELP